MSAGEYTSLDFELCQCRILKVRNGVNLDLYFINDTNLKQRYQTAAGETKKVQSVDPRTFLAGPAFPVRVYRARLCGIRNLRKVEDESQIELEMQRWLDITGGMFRCWAGSIDIYGRILVRIVDPVVDIDMGQYLIENHPEQFERYVRPGDYNRSCSLPGYILATRPAS